MKTVQITADNENRIAEQFKDFDRWAYDQMLLKLDDGTPLMRMYFKEDNDFGVFLCHKIGDEYISRFSFTNEEIVDINVLDKYFQHCLQIAKGKPCCLNIYTENENIIKFFHSKYNFDIDFKGYLLRITKEKANQLSIKNTELIEQEYNSDHLMIYLELLDKSFASWDPGSSDFINSKKYYSDQFSQSNDNGKFASFWINDRIVGLYYICDNMIIHTIAVHPEYKNKGYGSIILRQAVKIIMINPSVEECKLSVHELNKGACGFYKKNGFDVIAHCVEATMKK